MLCLRVARGSRPSTVLRRLLLAAVSAGAGFLLLYALGYALAHPGRADKAGLRLLWCLVPVAAVIHLSVALSRLPGGGRRSAFAATGYGTSRLPLLAAAGTALPFALGGVLALLAFLRLRGGLLDAEPSLPLAGTLTLLASLPLLGAAATAFALRSAPMRPAVAGTGPRRGRPAPETAQHRNGRTRHPGQPERTEPAPRTEPAGPTRPAGTTGLLAATDRNGRPGAPGDPEARGVSNERNGPDGQAGQDARTQAAGHAAPDGHADQDRQADRCGQSDRSEQQEQARAERNEQDDQADHDARQRSGTAACEDSGIVPAGLPWGTALAATGLALELYADRWKPARPGDRIFLPGGLGGFSSTMLMGWSLTAVGLVLAGPGLVHLAGRLLAAARPGALRLIAGRGLQAEAGRIGRPLGVLCAAGSAAVAAGRLSGASAAPAAGPLTVFGAGLVLVCAVATVFASAAESRGARSPVTETLSRLGASAEMMRQVSVARAAVLLVVLVPLTWLVGELAAMPMHL